MYDGRALDQLRLIRHARAIGLSLADARALFAQSPSGADCNRVREIIERKIEELDRRVAEIERFRGELADYRARCDAALGRKERRCPIFETA